MRCANPSTIAVFPDARLSDQDRIIFCAARKYLHDAPNFFISADYRIKRTLASQFVEIPGIAFECLIFTLRIRVGNSLIALISTNTLNMLSWLLPPDVKFRGLTRFFLCYRNQNMFRAHIFVFETGGFGRALSKILFKRADIYI